MEENIIDILRKLPQMEEKVKDLQDMILTNLVMLGEIPAPTFREENRLRFLVNRLTQSQLLNCSTDEVGNGLGILPGERGDKNILIVAHMDTLFDEKIDHTCSVHPNYVSAPGISDNTLGVAVMASLPEIISALDIKLNSNLILMGSSRSLGRGNTEGLRFFLKNTKLPIYAGISVEGVRLGRLSYSSIGMTRCEIAYSVPEEYDWTRFGAVGSIVTINEVINRILEIPLPRRPKSSIVFNSIEGGTFFSSVAKTAILRLEIRSESEEMVKALSRSIRDIASEVSSHTGEAVEVDIISQTNPGGIEFAHPFAVNTRAIMHQLNIKPRISPSTSELAAFISAGIPALTIGMTRGENLGELSETIEIQPIFTGIAQLLGIILALDRGLCDGN
ncbi:MAG: peptidase [Spirochaetales bacterium]|nr:peptidase [Spirochaetales bacterium]